MRTRRCESGARSIPTEYYTLRVLSPAEAKSTAETCICGYIAGLPIFETVVDSSGERYCYVGLVPRLSDGRYDVNSLAPGEWIVEPG
ncbi:MAG: hypothetical protein EOS81_30890 [Mesorhizobium sp.]|nr:MAG: hypothetical protein EOS81_30890 [Mesorhizobium sp.]